MMSNSERSIALNFLPLAVQEIPFIVFRKEYAKEKREGPLEQCMRRSLPINPDDTESRGEYWISFQPIEGFEEFPCRESFNHWLTEDFLYLALRTRCEEKLSKLQYSDTDRFFKRLIAFEIRDYNEGKETVWLQPYYLSISRLFGFLIDFEFRKNKGIPFSRRVQQLSLSLDKNFRSNTNFYLDRYEKIQSFMKLYYSQLFPIPAGGGLQLDIQKSLYQLPADRLDTKRYVFANNKEKNSQFNGVKEFGPYEPVKNGVVFYFMCLQRDTDFANQLFKALKGDLFKPSFPGMQAVFGMPTERGMVKGKTLADFTRSSLEEGLREVKQIRDAIAIPILILQSKTDEASKRAYYLAKYLFINENIPLQVVTLDVLKNVDTFKWATSNIGLQVFSKLGGKPWKVKPNNEECLIVGVGQSHDEIEEQNGVRVIKYFAYSVLTDSSGIYLDLEVLGNSGEKSTYLDQLERNLRRIITDYCGRFKRIVIHTPFKLRLFELESIKHSLESLKSEIENEQLEFIVLKVNTENKFFGYDLSANSKVPFESTFLKLSSKDFLVWFEGLQYHNPNVYRRFAGPTHIEFYYSSVDIKERKRAYLQDVLNLSGANWRGFNAKSMPVSILYCQLVARFINEFNRRGYRDYKIDNLKPWFL